MIKYSKGFKYQLKEDYIIQTEIIGFEYSSRYIELSKDGTLLILDGYAWDGASGPTKDDKTNMEGSLVHDALYQIMRQEAIPRNYQGYADKLFQTICKNKGMNFIRAWYYLKGLEMFGASSNDPENKRKIYKVN